MVGPFTDTGEVEGAWSVTVVIPAFDAEATLPRTLEALARVHLPQGGSIEIVVSDDGSTDGTVAVAERDLSRLRVVRGERSGPAAARNRGAAIAGSEVLAFVDSGDEPYRPWLDQIVQAFDDPVVGLASWPALLIDAFHAGEPLRRLNAEPIGVVGLASCFAVRRSVFEAIGGYDEALRCGENADLCERAVAYCAAHALRTAQAPDVAARVVFDQPPEHYDRPRLDAAEHLIVRDAERLAADRSRAALLHAIAAVNAARCDEWARARRHAWSAVRRGRTGRDVVRLLVAWTPPVARRRWCAKGRRRIPVR